MLKNVSNCKASAKARQNCCNVKATGKSGENIKAAGQNAGKNSIKSGENV